MESVTDYNLSNLPSSDNIEQKMALSVFKRWFRSFQITYSLCSVPINIHTLDSQPTYVCVCLWVSENHGKRIEDSTIQSFSLSVSSSPFFRVTAHRGNSARSIQLNFSLRSPQCHTVTTETAAPVPKRRWTAEWMAPGCPNVSSDRGFAHLLYATGAEFSGALKHGIGGGKKDYSNNLLMC